jgi:hypothetical protein
MKRKRKMQDSEEWARERELLESMGQETMDFMTSGLRPRGVGRLKNVVRIRADAGGGHLPKRHNEE